MLRLLALGANILYSQDNKMTQNNDNNIYQPNRRGKGKTYPFVFAHTPEEDTTDPEDEEFVYIFTQSFFGLLVLIINSQFDHEKNRDYAQQDLENMQRVFGDLGFQIRVMLNLTTEQLNTQLKEGEHTF